MFALTLTFDDDPARIEGRPAHRDRLRALTERGLLVGAGPWSDDSGALLLFRVETREEAEAIVADDPYYAGPGVTSAALQEWKPVSGDLAS